jgi:PAS domain S-box-containing protein
MRRLGTGVLALGVVAISATALVAGYRQRHRGRSSSGSKSDDQREPRSDQQAALRDAARELGESTSVAQAVQVIAEHAVRTTRAFGAYVERIEEPRTKGEVEVVAVVGRGGPPLGTRIPYPGSLTQELIESGEAEIMTELGAIGERMAPYLHESCRQCSGLVVPLSSKSVVLGTLVLLRGRDQPHFTQQEATHVRALGGLLTAAFQRLLVIDELRESEGRFNQLADHLNEIIWLGAPDLSARYYVNPAYEKIFGCSRQSFYDDPRSPVEVIHPEDRERVETALRRLSHGGSYETEYRIIRPDGAQRWIWSRAYPIRNERGEVYRVAGIMEDITTQKEAEQERERLLTREREARVEVSTVIESITDAFITVDENWKVVYMNHAVEALLHRSREELLGKDFWTAFPAMIGTRFEHEYRRAMAEQRPVALEEYYAPIGRWLDVRVYPSANRLSIYYRDVTNRKRVEEDLQTRIKQLNALAALGQFALAETDLDALFSRAVEVTARELGVELVELLELLEPSHGHGHGHGEAELLLRAGTGWGPGQVGRTTMSASRESMAGYTLLSDEPVITEDLRSETRFRPSPILAEHGGRSGVAVIVQGRHHPWGALGAHTTRLHRFTSDDIFFLQSVSNILGQAIELRRVESERMQLLEREREARAESERNRAEAERGRAELQRITESRARLMRGFSHDVKNPLGAADGFLQLMEEGIIDHLTGPQKDGVARARRAIGDAVSLIGDLLTIARAEAGKITVEREPTDLQSTITAVVESFQARAATQGLTLTADLAADLPTIDSDPDRIRQILGNLLSNAIKYTKHGGITVSVGVWGGEAGGEAGSPRTSGQPAPPEHPALPGPGRWVAIDVSDTGPGIQAEQIGIIFQEFGRAEAGATGESQGIGLYISQRIAQALGGTVTVHSEVGKGSTFTLWLPVEQTEAEGAREA